MFFSSAPSESEEDDDLVLKADTGKKMSYTETARMFKLRRNLDQLDCFRRQKERDVQTARFEPGNNRFSELKCLFNPDKILCASWNPQKPVYK